MNRSTLVDSKYVVNDILKDQDALDRAKDFTLKFPNTAKALEEVFSGTDSA